MWEYLSLYAERVDTQEAFMIKNYPEPRERVDEQELLNRLGAEGWELVTVVPAYGGGGGKLNHQLYLKRARGGWGEGTRRLDR
jgi:Domain of unknown function (DUF4177)